METKRVERSFEIKRLKDESWYSKNELTCRKLFDVEDYSKKLHLQN